MITIFVCCVLHPVQFSFLVLETVGSAYSHDTICGVVGDKVSSFLSGDVVRSDVSAIDTY